MSNISELPVLAIIVPCYNEEEIIHDSSKILLSLLNNMIDKNLISPDSYICFIDDGSQDGTISSLREICKENNQVKAIMLACNFGQQKALLCAMVSNEADIYVTIDCDLQDDVNAIPQMVESYLNESVDVVYGVRNNRESDSFFKRFFAEAFYRISGWLGVKGLYNHSHFRLVSRKVVSVLENIKECNLYLRGLIYSLGFKYSVVYFKRKERSKGYTKYTFFKLLNIAIDGIISFSVMPIRLMLFLGILILILSLCLSSSVLFIGSLNLCAISIVGEYLYKVLDETKSRPNWVISERINGAEKN